MRAATMFATAGLMALCGCDQLGAVFGGGGADANEAQANGAAGGKDPAPGNVQVSDAGVTNSLSFAQTGPNNGGKIPSGDGGQTINASQLVGRWGDFGDCTKNVIDIEPDGTFRAANGGVGAWQLEGNRLTFSGDQQTITMTLQSLDANGLIVIQPDGSVGRSQRC